MTQVIQHHTTNIVSNEQLSRQNTWGTVHAMLLDKAETQIATTRRHPISSAWFDFRKAYDSVYNHCLKKRINALPIDDRIKKLFRATSRHWNLRIQNGKELGERVKVER